MPGVDSATTAHPTANVLLSPLRTAPKGRSFNYIWLKASLTVVFADEAVLCC